MPPTHPLFKVTPPSGTSAVYACICAGRAGKKGRDWQTQKKKIPSHTHTHTQIAVGCRTRCRVCIISSRHIQAELQQEEKEREEKKKKEKERDECPTHTSLSLSLLFSLFFPLVLAKTFAAHKCTQDACMLRKSCMYLLMHMFICRLLSPIRPRSKVQHHKKTAIANRPTRIVREGGREGVREGGGRNKKVKAILKREGEREGR
ncbi:hypothetical protein MOQ_008316 [Trypanosoma cruzi marinkellei]|uniref:Uncharacterized protein n=1 Tax=Trypanosoma cruzi marinkellei TaxID=85056 RepID=K2MZZ4_TRYCR|nr:hypothetical protein MOQ_008316 [Trypanosoma cruzi marinkellei]